MTVAASLHDPRSVAEVHGAGRRLRRERGGLWEGAGAALDAGTITKCGDDGVRRDVRADRGASPGLAPCRSGVRRDVGGGPCRVTARSFQWAEVGPRPSARSRPEPSTIRRRRSGRRDRIAQTPSHSRSPPASCRGDIFMARSAKNVTALTPRTTAAPEAIHRPRDDVTARGFDAVNGALVAVSTDAAGELRRRVARRGERRRGSLVGDIEREATRFTLSPAAAASASESSSALWKRRAGSFSSARRNHASNAGPRPGTIDEGTGAGVVQIFTRRSPTDTPSKGKTPQTHLNAMTPIDQRSTR